MNYSNDFLAENAEKMIPIQNEDGTVTYVDRAEYEEKQRMKKRAKVFTIIGIVALISLVIFFSWVIRLSLSGGSDNKPSHEHTTYPHYSFNFDNLDEYTTDSSAQ